MCNLYELYVAEMNQLFGKNLNEVLGNLPARNVYPGYPGIVMTADRELRTMTWGFPLKQVSKKTGKPLKPKPVNNARTDKLDSFMWKHSFEERRCLIPVTRFAEAEGSAGKMTRTWFSVPDEAAFACAGIWRKSDEWGNVYSMVMTESTGAVEHIHNRMPVILSPPNHDTWLDGSSDHAKQLCKPYAATLTVDRTTDLWFSR